jgi:hypothetical protein
MNIWVDVYQATLILEPDCILRSDADVEVFTRQLDNFDMIFLGGQPLGFNPPPTTTLVATQKYGQVWGRTHAYLLNGYAAYRLITHRWLHNLPWRYQLPVRVEGGSWDIGYVWPPVAGQAAGRSTITGRDEPERWWYPEYDNPT